MRSACFALLTHFRSTAIAAVAFVCAASADEKIIVAFRIGAAVVFARIEQQLIQIKINCLHKIAALPKAGKFFLRQVHLRSGGIDIIVDDIEQDASGKSVVKAYAWNIFSENYSPCHNQQVCAAYACLRLRESLAAGRRSLHLLYGYS